MVALLTALAVLSALVILSAAVVGLIWLSEQMIIRRKTSEFVLGAERLLAVSAAGFDRP